MVDSLALNRSTERSRRSPPHKPRNIHLFAEGVRDKERSL